MAPSSPPTLPKGSEAAFLCHLLPTHCCMSPVCQPTPGSNTRSQGTGIEPRGEGARLPSCPSSPPGITYPLPFLTPTLECCPLGNLRGEGLIPVLSPEGREDGVFGGRRMPSSHSAVFKAPINGTLCSLCFSRHSSRRHFFHEMGRGSGPRQGGEGGRTRCQWWGSLALGLMAAVANPSLPTLPPPFLQSSQPCPGYVPGSPADGQGPLRLLEVKQGTRVT